MGRLESLGTRSRKLVVCAQSKLTGTFWIKGGPQRTTVSMRAGCDSMPFQPAGMTALESQIRLKQPSSRSLQLSTHWGALGLGLQSSSCCHALGCHRIPARLLSFRA